MNQGFLSDRTVSVGGRTVGAGIRQNREIGCKLDCYNVA
jgi:hypothetical protein